MTTTLLPTVRGTYVRRRPLAVHSAASIIAKVPRDTIMRELHAQYPDYGWYTNVRLPDANTLR